MTEAFIALMALVTLAAVLWPIYRRHELTNETLVEDNELGEALAKKDAALLAIDELEADFQMGNLSEADYAELRNKYDEQAVSVLKSVDEVRGDRSLVIEDDEFDALIEAQIATRRRNRRSAPAATGSASCRSCGRGIVPGASFCAYCGAVVANTCRACAAEVSPDARFCAHCGTVLQTVPAEL